MTKITEIYLNFHGNRPSMPFTSEEEARARAASPAFDENPLSEVAASFIRREAVLLIIDDMAALLQKASEIGVSKWASDARGSVLDIRDAIAALGNPGPGAAS